MALYSRRTKFKTAKGLIKPKSAIPRLGGQKKTIGKLYPPLSLPKAVCDLNKIKQNVQVCVHSCIHVLSIKKH